MVFKINKVVKNFFSVGFANILSQIIVFFTIAYYARILTVEGFGLISLAQSILIYFTMITLFGFQTYGTREVAKDNSKVNELVGDVILFRMLIASLCYIVLLLIASVVDKGIDFRNILILYGLNLFALAFNLDWVFSGLNEMKHNAVYSILKNVIPFMLIISFLKSENTLYLIPLFTFIGLITASIYHVYIFVFKKNLRCVFKPNVNKLYKYLKYSSPFLISSLLSMINCNVDSIVIGFIRGTSELGIYSSAYKIIFFLINLIGIIFIPIFPVLISKFAEKKNTELKILVNNTTKLVVLVSIPLCVGGILLSKEIIILIFGVKFISAYVPLNILLIYILILFMREMYGYGLNAWNMERQYLKSVCISSSFNLIFNMIFIPIYGMNAAAIITVLSEIINFVLMKKYADRVVKTNYLKHIVKISLPVMVMSTSILILKYFNIHVLANIIIAIIIYFISIFSFKYITLKELKSLLRK